MMLVAFLGMHYFVTRILGFTLSDSLFLLTPAILVFIPLNIFFLYVNHKKYISNDSVKKYGKTINEQSITIGILTGYGVISVVSLIAGVFFLLIERRSILLGCFLLAIGIVISLRLVKKLKLLYRVSQNRL